MVAIQRADEPTDEQPGIGRTIKRRGILAAAGAAVAGIVAKQTAQPVAAAPTPWYLDQLNFVASPTYLADVGGYGFDVLMHVAATDNGGGNVSAIEAIGHGTGSGLIGMGGGGGGPGITATGGTSNGPGVVGNGANGGNADGVQGFGQGFASGIAGFGGNNGGVGVFGFGGLQGVSSHVGAGVVGTTNGYIPANPIIAGTVGLSNVTGIPGVYGVASSGSTHGVIGSGANGGAGVFGINSNAVGIGVHGFNDHGAAVQGNTSEGTGVNGIAGTTGYGVAGTSASGVGVYGTTGGVYGVYGASAAPGGVGVSGNCTGGYGVLGTVSDGYGVLGQANTGNGLYGFSQQNHAVVGQTARPYFGGVFGVATIANTVGIYGSTKSGGSNVASAYAGYMDGNFVVANGFKSAAVAHADGTHRLVYCLESPESWLEDFGKAKLVGGKAEVHLDPEFAALVQTDDYHVFLTAYGNTNGLHVPNQSATGFSVQEHNGGRGSLTFSWRVVAKRKDIAAQRLAKFDLPGKAIPEITPPHAPQPLTVPSGPPVKM